MAASGSVGGGLVAVDSPVTVVLLGADGDVVVVEAFPPAAVPVAVVVVVGGGPLLPMRAPPGKVA
ncbi:MAG TPA: hypothetical protein VG795_16260, partial [Acidimicrobiia bacterium]|nr:hypothetical protein [Acidimicrobiia bacterium]